MQKNVLIHENFWKTEGFPYKKFQYSETTFFRRQIVDPLLFIKLGDIRSLLKHRMVPSQKFWVLREKKLSTKKCDNPTSGPKMFDIRNFVKHRRVPSQKFWVLREKKLSTKKCDNPASGPKMFDIRNFVKHRRVPLRKVSVQCNAYAI